jgi:hypothetical protein
LAQPARSLGRFECDPVGINWRGFEYLRSFAMSANRCSARIGIALAFLAVAPVSAFAQGRPDSTAMSCAQARGVVTRAGAIVLGTGGPTFERVVNSAQFCTPDEFTQPFWAPTADARQCMVGYTCEPRAGRSPTAR